MNKPIPKQPLKVSKAKKTLPVEIDWGQGMKDRLRYISPGEEALIQRNRSTDAERYYGGIRAYPDPEDTAQQSTGNWQGAPGSGTTSTGAGGTTGGGSDSGSMSGATSAPSSSPAGAVGAGSEAGAVSASRAADESYSGSKIGGAENALSKTEETYRQGINSLRDGAITSGNIVTTTSPTYSPSSYSYTQSIPAPVSSTSTAASVYGPDYVTDDMLPDYSSMLPSPPQYVSAVDSLKGMLAKGGTYVGPVKTPQAQPNPASSAPSTMAYQGALDRLASGTSIVGTTNPVGYQKIADRVPGGGIADISDGTFSDTVRGINTIASAEGSSAVDVADSFSTPVPQTNASAAKSYSSMRNPTSLAQGMQSPGVRYSTWNSTAPEFDPTGGVKYQYGENDAASEKVLDVEDVPAEASPLREFSETGAPIRLSGGEDALPPGYTDPGVFEANIAPKVGYSASVKTRGMGVPSTSGGVTDIADEESLPSPLDITDETGGISTDYSDGESVEAPSQEGIAGLTGDEATDAALEAGIQGNVAYADWFRDDPAQLGTLKDVPDIATVEDPTNMAKVHQRAMANKYEGEDPYLTQDEKIRAKVSEGVERMVTSRAGLPGRVLTSAGKKAMGIEDASDFLGRPSYEQDALYDYSRDAAERYGRTNLQGGRYGGGSPEEKIALWQRGIGIPGIGDPDYPAYSYWVNSSGWGWS